jgi:hypothetical protein
MMRTRFRDLGKGWSWLNDLNDREIADTISWAYNVEYGERRG